MRSVTCTIMAALAACLIAESVHAVEIPVSARDRVERQCLPSQHREGAAAYRQCVTEAIERIGDSSAGKLSSLDLDEQFLVQSFCDGAADGACVDEQLAALADAPTISLGSLSSDERLTLDNLCLTRNDGDGAVAFRECLREQVRGVASEPKPMVSSMGLLQRNALELSCAGEAADLVDYRRCVVATIGSVTDNADSALTDAGAAAQGDSNSDSANVRDTNDNDSVNAAEVATADALDVSDAASPPGNARPSAEGEADSSGTRSASSQDNDGQDNASSGFMQLIDDARIRMTGSLEALDTTGKTVLAAAIALPLLLVGLWAMMRSRGDEEYELDYTSDSPDHLEPDLGLGDERYDDEEPFDDFNAPARASSPEVPDDAAYDDLAPTTTIARSLSIGERGARQPSLDRAIDVDLDDNVTRLAPKPELDLTEHRGRSAAFAWQSAFGEWLSKQAPHSRLQSTIELFIYWVAYADDRYDEQMRHTVLTEEEPDAHDLIKRWVLQYDAYALTDAISWMQGFASRTQRSQTLDLLMTLLVTDGAMTPVQNTLLRFLADAFGLGEAELDLQYARAFGEPMPALPRVDKPGWWAQQDQVRMDRWDASGLLMRPEEDQFRIRLGLSLTGELDDQDINDAYRRAIRRCQPDRFDALGQRELALVKRQMGKLEEAREGLLGVNA